MKYRLMWIVLAFVTAAHGATLDAGTRYPPELKPLQQEAQAARLTAELLARYHYRNIPLDAAFSTSGAGELAHNQAGALGAWLSDGVFFDDPAADGYESNGQGETHSLVSA